MDREEMLKQKIKEKMKKDTENLRRRKQKKALGRGLNKLLKI
jgi:hypothetical protein